MSKIREELEELEKKAGSYTVLKEDYDNLVQGVKEAVVKLNAIITTHSTITATTKTDRAPYGSRKIWVEKIYEAMKHDDLQVTAKVIMEKSGLSYTQANIIINNLKKMEGVNEAKDGIKIRLFYKKTSSQNSINEQTVKFGKTSSMG